MVKHTQTIPREIGDKLFECVWPFCGIGAKRVKMIILIVNQINHLPLDIRLKLNVDKTFRKRHGRLLNILYVRSIYILCPG